MPQGMVSDELWGLVEGLLPPEPARPKVDRACPQGRRFRASSTFSGAAYLGGCCRRNSGTEAELPAGGDSEIGRRRASGGS